MPARKDTNVISHRLNDPTLEKLQTISTVTSQSVASLVRDFTEQAANKEFERLEFLTSICEATGGCEAGGIELSVLAGATTRMVEGANKWSIASGIYALFNEVTRSLYVGSSSCLSKRIKTHSSNITKRSHHNDELNSWLVEDVVVIELEHCKPATLLQREQYWIDTLRKCDTFQLANIANPISQGRDNEKVVGTRMNEAVVEKLEQLAVLRDRTVSQLVRMAVEALLEAEERTLHPLSLEAAVSLGGAIGAETSLITANATSLTHASYGNAGGVYLLVSQESRELYVGSSTELTARLTHHKFSIKTSTHKNSAINGWLVDEVVVVILESCEGVKNAAGKKALLAREQHYIDKLKVSTDWTLLNLGVASATVDASTTSSSSSSGRRSLQVVVSPPSTASPKRTQETTVAAPPAPPSPSAFETFYTTVIEQSLLLVLQEERASRDVVRLFEGCKDEQDKRWFLEFLGSYNSQWLVGLGESGKFPWIAKLLEQARALEKTNL